MQKAYKTCIRYKWLQNARCRWGQSLYRRSWALQQDWYFAYKPRATQLPIGWSAQSSGQNHKWPRNGQIAYITPTVGGGGGGGCPFRVGEKISSGPQTGSLAT